jgi:hypothetical protein
MRWRTTASASPGSDRTADGVQELGRRLGSWLDRWQTSGAGADEDDDLE